MTEARAISELLELSADLQSIRRAKRRLKDRYFTLTFHLTRLLEELGLPRARSIPDKSVLNFGCGLNLLDAVINPAI